MDFGPVLIGAGRTFTIPVSNPNGTPVALERAEVRGDASFFLPEPLPTIPERSSVLLPVRFSPFELPRGDRSAELELDVGPFITTVRLTGFAIDVTLIVEPEALDLGGVGPGSERTTAFRITNPTEVPASFRLRVPGGSAFRAEGSETIELPAFGSGELSVRFDAPLVVETTVRTAQLRFETVGLAADAVLVPARAEVQNPVVACAEPLPLLFPEDEPVAEGKLTCINLTGQEVRVVKAEAPEDDRFRVVVLDRNVGPDASFELGYGFDAGRDAFGGRARTRIDVFARTVDRLDLPLSPAEVVVVAEAR